MTTFSQLMVEVLPTGRHYRLLREMIVTSHIGTTTIPAGFVTDFASVPRPLWPLSPPSGEWSPAAVYHDYLYQLGSLTRAEADKEFADGMASLGVPWPVRQLMYWSLRMFGWIAWDEYERQREFMGEMDSRD